MSPPHLQLLSLLLFFGSVLAHLELEILRKNTAQLKYLLQVPSIENKPIRVQSKCEGGGEFGGFLKRVPLLYEDTLDVLVDRFAQVDHMDPAG